MGDLLPPEASTRRALARCVLQAFGLSGYDLVVPPLFEHADVIERGLDTLDGRELLRFVEPESGEVAVLRPDITPQIARIVATRLADRPPPWRLSYEGPVIRRRRGRARRHRQIAQAGIECLGWSEPEADCEVITTLARACEAVGLSRFRIELSHVSVARSALERVPERARDEVAEALSRKDKALLKHHLAAARTQAQTRDRVLALVDQYGDADALRQARARLRWPEARVALRELTEITDRLDSCGLRARLGIDLSETRGSSYYTGVSFSLLAEGPGEPLGYGGRYDELMGRYGTPMPATGFALDLDNLRWSLDRTSQPWKAQKRLRLVVAGDAEISHQLAAVLRAADVVAAVLPTRTERESLAFAQAWGYDAVLACGRRVRVTRVSDAHKRTWRESGPALLRDRSHPERATETLQQLLAWVKAEPQQERNASCQ